MWKYVKEKYDIPEAAKVWVLESIQNAWRKYKNTLMKEHFKPYENDELRMEKRSIDVSESQFRELLKYWNSDSYKKMSRTNIENRRKLRYPHTTGKTSFALICEVEQMKKTEMETVKI
nr:uncharacterized protein LOC104086300 isoform X2 [Nicotiana tomentosiformis]